MKSTRPLDEHCKRSDITGFTIGPLEIVFVRRCLVVIAITLHGRTYRPLDR